MMKGKKCLLKMAQSSEEDIAVNKNRWQLNREVMSVHCLIVTRVIIIATAVLLHGQSVLSN